jgi:uncharacterized protein (DUF488 family)
VVATDAPPVFTIGHSTLLLEDFLALLAENAVERVVDVRRYPASRRYPQYDSMALRDALKGQGADYEHVVALGGRRGRDKSIDPATNGFWTHASFHQYADYAMTAPFQAALDDLLAASAVQRCAITCAEAVWWRCHRRIITDYLLARGRDVLHIFGPGKVEPATLTPAARDGDDGRLVYPPPGPVQLELDQLSE